MDLRIYYETIREIEAGVTDEYPVIVSKATGDGGKAGTMTEVPRRLAARMVVDGIAALASAEETAAFRARQAEALRSAEQTAAAARLQISVLSTRELEQLRLEAKKQSKG
jgi:hypothetical protein